MTRVLTRIAFSYSPHLSTPTRDQALMFGPAVRYALEQRPVFVQQFTYEAKTRWQLAGYTAVFSVLQIKPMNQ